MTNFEETNSRIFWYHERLRRIAVGLLIAISIGLVVGFIIDEKGTSLLKRGDFPGFYVQPIIKHQGQMSRLYDVELQRTIENQFWPSFEGSFYMSVYPPYVATLLYPLALLPPQAAQLVFTFIMLLLFALSCLYISRLNSTFSKEAYINSLMLICFAPLFFGIFGAQNTALSMFLYAASLYFIKQKTFRYDLVTGVLWGIWLFKPQFAVFFLLIAFIARRWWIILGSLIPAFIFYTAAAKDMGIFWPFDWLKSLSAFSFQNFITNAPQNVSIVGTGKALIYSLGWKPDSWPAYLVLGSVITIAALIAIRFSILVWLSSRKTDAVDDSLYQLLLMFGPLLLLLSPQTLFYDLGIALVSLAICLNFNKDKTYWTVVAINILAAPIVYFREEFPLPFFFLFPLGFLYLMKKSKLVFQ